MKQLESLATPFHLKSKEEQLKILEAVRANRIHNPNTRTKRERTKKETKKRTSTLEKNIKQIDSIEELEALEAQLAEMKRKTNE